MRVRPIVLLFVVTMLVNVAPAPLPARAQVAAPPAQTRTVDEGQVNKLPAALRERGRLLLSQTDEVERARLARALVREPGTEALEFLLWVLSTDPSARVRFEILDRAGRLTDHRVRQVLPQIAAADPDTRLALLALEQLRTLQTRELSQLLAGRLEVARTSGTEADLHKLASEHERWISLVRGTMLPAFMRIPPEVFSLKKSDEPVRVLAFGDFGTGSEGQKKAAAAMQGYHRQSPFDFGITFGDNFYSVGMESPVDPRWKTQWEAMYEPLAMRFYATLGNHDWGLADSPAAELLYAKQSSSFLMPSPYYTFTAGPVQFFALDTNEVSEAQLIWLKDALATSNATWKVVYGHHPIYSVGAHGDNTGLIQRLLPVLKRGRADVFFAGHDHDFQHLKAEDGLHFFVAGVGGAGLRQPKPGPRSIFATAEFGFAVIEADARQLKVRFVNAENKELHQATLSKAGSVAVLVE
ncbi:MAG: metallophosphoesterase [Acidobacteriota bacterium]